MTYNKYTLKDGKETFYRLGYNSAITTAGDPEDVWEEGGLYIFPTADTLVNYIISDQAADLGNVSNNENLNGVGARTVMVRGLDEGFNEINELVFMNGTTGVILSNEYYRINEMKVIATGTDLKNKGNIKLQHWNGSSASGTYGIITPSQNILISSVYTTPNNRLLYIENIEVNPTDLASVTSTSAVNYSIKIGERGVLHELYRHTGSSYLNIDSPQTTFTHPLLILPRTDIKIKILQVGATMGVKSIIEGYFI